MAVLQALATSGNKLVLHLNFLAFIVPEIVEFIQIDGHENSTRLLILVKTIYSLNARKRVVLQVTYFSTKLV